MIEIMSPKKGYFITFRIEEDKVNRKNKIKRQKIFICRAR
jgi:hypothetical protein